MKKQIFTILFTILSLGAFAQVSINNDNSNPDPSAMLDVKSTDKGLLIPRMTTAQLTALENPATGLLVFSSDTESFWFKETSGWTELKDGNIHSLSDADGDTKIQVEETPDNDTIRFDIGGTEYFRMGNGHLEVLNTGNSIFIGEGAGTNDEMIDNYNVAVGKDALHSNTSGKYNVATGTSSLFENSSGFYNTAIGQGALKYNTTGNLNTAIGSGCLYGNTIGDNNTCLGAWANVGSIDLHNATAIGYYAQVNKSNSVVLGHNANVGIGTNSPDYKLHVSGGLGSVSMMLEADTDNNYETDHPQLIFSQDGGAVISRIGMFEGSNDFSIRQEYNSDIQFFTHTNLVLRLSAAGNLVLYTGNAYKPGGGSWAATSDRRLKKNIKPYNDGLETILQLNPVFYNYNEKSGFDTKETYVGVIAQELQKIAPYMMEDTKEKDGEEYLQVDNSAMTYMLINAVKEQQKQIEDLKSTNSQLQAQVNKINTRLQMNAQK